MKDSFNTKEVIELIRYYCKLQRITCQLPVSLIQYGITKEVEDSICEKIRIESDIERFIPYDQESFGDVLMEIEREKKQNE